MKTNKTAESETVKTPLIQKLRKNRLLLGAFSVIALSFLLYSFKSVFIAAMVNGRPIWRSTLTKALETQAGNKTLDSLITRDLILQAAGKQKVSAGDEEINQAVKQLEDNLAKQGQNLDQALSAQGMTKNELKEQIRLQKIVEKILGKEITITDKEISDFIDKNKSFLPKDYKIEEVTASAKEQLTQQKLNEKAQTWIQALRTSAKINYFVKF